MPLARLLASFALGGREADFRRDIQPILSNHCFPCHGPDAAERKANLRSIVNIRTVTGGILIPEHPESSAIIHRVLSQDPAEMPPPTLTEGGTAGPPSRPPLPEVHHADWVRNPIDAFVLHLLELQGLTPSPRAEPHTLAPDSLALTASHWDRSRGDAGHPGDED